MINSMEKSRKTGVRNLCNQCRRMGMLRGVFSRSPTCESRSLRKPVHLGGSGGGARLPLTHKVVTDTIFLSAYSMTGIGLNTLWVILLNIGNLRSSI